MDNETWMEAHSKGMALGLAAGDERNRELRQEIDELNQQLTAYQIAKDNLELRLRHSVFTDEHQYPEQVY
jgi:cell division septum initiation protein DivIVA